MVIRSSASKKKEFCEIVESHKGSLSPELVWPGPGGPGSRRRRLIGRDRGFVLSQVQRMIPSIQARPTARALARTHTHKISAVWG